ncbi:sulfur oxidation c-type cytochrome SoxA [Microbaculum marinum]|uniref:SoxAX cytochrome complex subunit A n=1 Tax=Microbaculum marinum TaxID=1764581 RepID=A0AAW9RVX0_9HYPH
MRTIATGVAGLALAGAIAASAEPALEETLEIDGQEMITQAPAPEGHPFDTVISGWHYRTPETRALETDTFVNPAMLYVERGEEIWNTVEGTAGKSCASCHGDAAESMKGVGASMPKWNAKAGKPYNMDLQINDCRVEQMGAEPYAFDAADQKALVAFVKHQSLGMPVGLDLTEGEMRKWWEQGKEIYYTRFGQLDLSCASCHEQHNGRHIRADHLSQGQVNGFPTYRLKQADLVSVQNRFKGCVRDTRAVPFEPLGDEAMALETYVTWRGTGLSVETPAVRQ